MATLADLAYSEAVRGLAEMQAVVDGARTRGATLFGGTTVAAAFLADRIDLERASSLVWVLAVLGSMALAASVVFVVLTSWPREVTFEIDVAVLLDDASWRGLAKDEERTIELARFLADYRRKGKPTVKKLWLFVRGVALCGSASVLLFLIALLVGSRP